MTRFNILKEYVKSISFSSIHTPSIFFSNDESESTLGINIDTKASGSNEGLYEVIVSIQISPKTENKEIFHISCEYASIITLNVNGSIDENEIRHILMVDVPQALYPIVRNFISHITFSSGFPPITLQNFDFEQAYKEKEAKGLLQEKNVEESKNVGVEHLTYDTLVNSFQDTEEGREFVQTCVSHGMNPELSFENTPMYKYLMRFIGVPNFKVPTYDNKEIENDLFVTLFCFIVTDENVCWRLEERDEDLDLFVTYETEFNDKAISEMDYSELESLLTSLTINSWVEYNVPLSNMFSGDIQIKADEYIDELGIQNLPTHAEFMELFGNFANTLCLDWNTVNSWYRKLEEIDLSTMKYRF